MNDFPRRIQMLNWVPAERAIYDAAQAVEAMPADVRLTDAVVLLGQARARVADFVDGVNGDRSTLTYAIPAGHVGLPDGRVVKVNGTLPMTKDGVVCMAGEEVYHPLQDSHFHLIVMKYDNADRSCHDERELPEDCEYIAHYSYYEHDVGFSTWETYDIRECYSTPEAATAAQAAAKGGGE